MTRLLFRAIALVAAVPLLIAIWLLGYFSLRSPAAAPADQAKHGLVGSYFVGGGQWDKDTPPTTGFAQIWSDPNDFMLPRAFTAPAATRVDAQIAFGQGKGFAAKEHMIWWPAGFEAPPGWAAVSPTDKPWDQLAGVIWKGYIHLPKAGAYYFGTISDGPSAVYLNQARVALNGIFGGALASDAFSFAKEDVEDFQQNLVSGAFGLNPRDQYVVSVEIDSPRDLPIEIRYNASQGFSHVASHGGIDLFWVTPDSPRDASGKPIAEIVPADALYAEPPRTIEKPPVRGANSTVSADHLYFPAEYAEGAVTLTIRLADKDGNPVAGKRVHVSSLTSYGNADAITQPEKPTDEKGETTAKIRAGEGHRVAHDSAIFATDVTDFVDVSQVAHVTFQQVPGTFFADRFSPYYDPRLSITPHPPVVGQPATIATGLKNNSKFPARVTVTFSTTDSNIGFTNYVELARVKDITFQPGESKQVSTSFTPKEAIGHKCWRVEVKGVYVAADTSGGRAFAAVGMPPAIVHTAAAAPSPQGEQIDDGAQHNGEVVAPCRSPDVSDPAMFCLPPGNKMLSRYGNWRAYPKGAPIHTVDPSTYTYDPSADAQSPHPHPGNDYSSHDAKGDATPLPFCSPIKGTVVYPNPPDEWNTVGVKSCDGKYIVQFLHASRVFVHDGQAIDRGTQLGETGGAGTTGAKRYAIRGTDKYTWESGTVHLHVQVKRASDGWRVDPNAEGPLVHPPACDPSPCPPVQGPGYYDNRGEMSSSNVPKSGPLKKEATQYGKRVEEEEQRYIDREFSCMHDPKCDEQWINDRIKVAVSASKLANDPPSVAYQRLAVAASDSIVGYMDAVATSMERYSGAEAAGDRDWTARHFTAMQLYLKRLAEALRRDAFGIQKVGEQMPPDDAAAQARLQEERHQFLEGLRQTGLTPEDLKVLHAAGIPEGTARARMYRVLAYPQQSVAGKPLGPDEGYIDVNPLPTQSVQRMLLDHATEERKWADEAERLAALPPGNEMDQRSGFLQEYSAGNPHDRQENVDLFIRPISIPPDWKLSIINAEELGVQGQKASGNNRPQYPVREVEAGKHYAVSLPAKAQVKVASVLIPDGELGARTTARWAVEGKIGNELIGGIVLEMNTPYVIADLTLPPVGSKEAEEELPASSSWAWARIAGEAAAGIVVFGSLVYVFFSWRRRHRTGPPPAA